LRFITAKIAGFITTKIAAHHIGVSLFGFCSPGVTGRFVLLPKNVVTGAAKVDIMSRSTHTG
jgi:hypothetical protein